MRAPVGKAIRRVAAAAAVAGTATVGGLALAPGRINNPPPNRTQTRGGDVVLSLGTTPQGRAVARGFIGVSFESWAVPDYAGNNPNAINPLLVKLLGGLSPEGGLDLRIGGDSGDSSWSPVHGMTPPRGVKYELTPAWFAVTRSLVRQTGAKVIFDLNLLSGEPRAAVAEAGTFLADVGRPNLQAFEIGNEGEYYSSRWLAGSVGRRVPFRALNYNFGGFQKDFGRVARQLPRLPLAGPATGSEYWLADTPRLLAAEPRVRLVTFHAYPLLKCVSDPKNRYFGSIDNLLAQSSSRGLLRGHQRDVAIAHERGVSFRVDEMNAVSCGGEEGVSDTFASSLWLLDALFQMKRFGVDGVNIHMRPDAPASQLFTFTNHGGQWSASVRPEYYGALMFNEAAPPGSRLLPVRQTGARSAVRSWATLAPGDRHHVVLINDTPDASHVVRVRVTPGVRQCYLDRLEASSVAATRGVTLAGRAFAPATSTGNLEGASTRAAIPATRGTCSVNLKGGSAAMITF